MEAKNEETGRGCEETNKCLERNYWVFQYAFESCSQFPPTLRVDIPGAPWWTSSLLTLNMKAPLCTSEHMTYSHATEGFLGSHQSVWSVAKGEAEEKVEQKSDSS